jgi:hypothetical protein
LFQNGSGIGIDHDDWSDILGEVGFQSRFRLLLSRNEFPGPGFNLSPEIGKISFLRGDGPTAMPAPIELNQTVASA